LLPAFFASRTGLILSPPGPQFPFFRTIFFLPSLPFLPISPPSLVPFYRVREAELSFYECRLPGGSLEAFFLGFDPPLFPQGCVPSYLPFQTRSPFFSFRPVCPSSHRSPYPIGRRVRPFFCVFIRLSTLFPLLPLPPLLSTPLPS